MVGESSEDEKDGPFIVDEDLESSPLIPPAEFRKLNNITNYAGVKVVGESIQIRWRPQITEGGKIVYCTMLESSSNSATRGTGHRL